MIPSEVVILCGEWETGPTPPELSNEEYNEVKDVTEIIRHPDFDVGGLGVENGNDIAIFKVDQKTLSTSFTSNIIPACLPSPSSDSLKEAVQSGWSNPPPLHFFERFGPAFLPFIPDTYKQWHHKLKIEDDCREPNTTGVFERKVKYPSVRVAEIVDQRVSFD